ncbi:hypothetical protein AOL_s00110g198 [Orbilia oligospora ATCC 24927]|uniref:BTB domain-containing protein n=1 Tax=Arthrobotrys oligospora (strain ATCC 24927 / CBS 115.81 / DSM 1491) TaxID=756982 RepID=G1XL28_ARTOA|nr:hypothetical protein AOL_s00110g198 [Orbilia oligospora ATCC 24927]EGX46034.1 hypothetical protein AOL_s00110g198 [Orbilia oligospora ATCC 24927]
MHQIIVCNSSDYFKSLCAGAPADELGCKLLSFDTTPRAFEVIGLWVYGDQDLENHRDTKAIEEALVYTESVGMEDLRVELLEGFMKLKLQITCNTANGYRMAPESLTSEAQWNIFEEICEHSLPRDLSTVGVFVAGNLPGVNPSPTWLRQLSTESKNGFMAAALIEQNPQILCQENNDIFSFFANIKCGFPWSPGVGLGRNEVSQVDDTAMQIKFAALNL